MPDTWWFPAEDLAHLHPSVFLGSIHGALLVRRADEATGWAAMRLCVRWDPGTEHFRVGVFGLARGQMVEAVNRLRELDDYEGLQFACSDDWAQAAQVIDALTGAPIRQLLKFEPSGQIEEAQGRAIVRWLRR